MGQLSWCRLPQSAQQVSQATFRKETPAKDAKRLMIVADYKRYAFP